MMRPRIRRYNKLELTWVNKDKILAWDEVGKDYVWVGRNDLRAVEPRILKLKKKVGGKESEPATLDRTAEEIDDEDLRQHNLLIRGDNLLALRAIERDFAKSVRLIYIDPPFNTGSRINSEGDEVGYDDGYEHSIWLSMMRDRLVLLRKLLKMNGAIFVHISDVEEHYLRCLLDEIFGRSNFINRITVRTKSPSGFQSVNPGVFETAEYILSYARDKKSWTYHPQYVETGYDSNYDRIITNKSAPPTEWKMASFNDFVAKQIGYSSGKQAKEKIGRVSFESMVAEKAIEYADRVFRFTAISDTGAGKKTVELKKKSMGKERVFVQEREKYPDRYIYEGQEISFYSKKLREIDGALVPASQLTNIWTDISWEGIASEGNVTFKQGKKPERLVRRIIEMASDPGDIVLDSFAGAGTTGAVAHKLGRKWVMIELGPQAETHALRRLEAVVNGSDTTGISKLVNWKGGGKFQYYVLGKSLFKRDSSGIIALEYDNGDLIESVCKIEGFKFVGREFLSKSALHGAVDSKRYCHVTEEFVTQDYVEQAANEISDDESLVIYCLRKSSKIRPPSNVEVKKIPRDITKKFGIPLGGE